MVRLSGSSLGLLSSSGVPLPIAGALTLTTPNCKKPVDDNIKNTATPHDLLVVELVGLTAAAVSTAAAIRRVKGSSDRFFLPVALASLKLPTGAMTAFLGLLLMRGQFVPGLTALDTSAQILAWALVFGYAQQLFTRFVDQQGQSILEKRNAAVGDPGKIRGVHVDMVDIAVELAVVAAEAVVARQSYE